MQSTNCPYRIARQVVIIFHCRGVIMGRCYSCGGMFLDHELGWKWMCTGTSYNHKGESVSHSERVLVCVPCAEAINEGIRRENRIGCMILVGIILFFVGALVVNKIKEWREVPPKPVPVPQIVPEQKMREERKITDEKKTDDTRKAVAPPKKKPGKG